MFGDGMFVDAFADESVLAVFVEDDFEVSVGGGFFEVVVEVSALLAAVCFVAHIVCNWI